jgi:hypothetical protein
MVALFLLIFCSLLSAEEPWGRDAIIKTLPSAQPTSSPALFLIQFHQRVISPTCGPRSHFLPTSSEYMRQAIIHWGAAKGFLLGCDRLMRENKEEWVYKKVLRPTGYVKWDPVPLPLKR